MRKSAIWTGLLAAMALPVGLAATSPFLAYRDAAHAAAGFSGVAALAMLLPQALLIAGLLPLSRHAAQMLHRSTGAAIAALVGLHVAGLWITSPQDMADALLFRAPTLFSVWGVLALGLLIAIALSALLRRRFAPGSWRYVHGLLAAFLVTASLAHALPIIGTMEQATKAALCLMIAVATVAALIRRLGARRRRPDRG
ncbi:ferric reductase-like transmembrane domain-containing protein [Fertoeibacter niger]|nr:ferric reductase-like transmembrane domain-containing protein [Fertoeibacter niger]